MLDFEKSIISSLLQCIDNVGANLVANTYQNLVQEYSPFIWVMTAIFIGFLFLQAKTGHKGFYDLLIAVFRTVFILTLVLHYDYFCLFIYDIVTKEPLTILKAITINGKDTGAATISHALDGFLNAGMVYANKLFLMGSWSNLTYFIFASIVAIMTIVSVIFAVGLIVLSKCAAIILLALSPLFIFCALFEMTKGLCESYIRHLITYALIPILTSAILMILLSASEYVIHFMEQFPKSSFKAIAPFLLLCGIQIYLLAQVFAKASALGSGFVLGSMVSTLNNSRENMKMAAGALTGGKMGRAMGRGLGKLFSSGSSPRRMNRYRRY